MAAGLGEGVYSVQEASALSGVSPRRIRRWHEGYTFGPLDRRHRMPPVVAVQPRHFDGVLQLSFLDLIEIRLIEEFLKFGVSWKELRHAARAGAELLKTDYPFASMKFKTDGRQIFADIKANGRARELVHIRKRQQVFRSVIEPALRGVQFDSSRAVRWWPLGTTGRVVIDPLVCFGKPVGSRSGVPVAILASHAARHGVPTTVRWYGVDSQEVQDALRFSERIAA
ncbi:MAG: hypothetical protein ACKVS8_04710 [Phycisphaerales bacterium]